MHMIQTPMVALVGVGLWLVVRRVDGADPPAVVTLAWLSRIATFVCIVYYTALDAIGGFGLARTIEIRRASICHPTSSLRCAT